MDEEILAVREAGRWRRLTPAAASKGPISFSSNDYLGLSRHPRVTAAAIKALEALGAGSGSSRLAGGHQDGHRILEEAVARWKGTEAALSFPSGYMANLAVMATLAGPDVLVVSDAHNHASIVDGCRLARAQVAVYQHADADHAAHLLSGPGPSRRILVSDTVFSMDGDVAPVADLAAAARSHRALLVLDEAHQVFPGYPEGASPKGHASVGGDASVDRGDPSVDRGDPSVDRGDAAADRDDPSVDRGDPSVDRCDASMVGADPPVPREDSSAVRGDPSVVRVGTFSKFLGSIGGMVAARQSVVDLMINRARPFMFTTAAAPADVAAATAALAIYTGPEGARLRARLRDNIDRLIPGHPSPIVAIILGAEDAAVAASHTLAEQGLIVPAIRPPTVAPGTSRLRVSVSATHTPADMSRLVKGLADLGWPFAMSSLTGAT
ncbi:MAG: aminotransferase class I/II-fold pyridoxal phosphate-dependent enzyme [Acidimicrobiales bacterium]